MPRTDTLPARINRLLDARMKLRVPAPKSAIGSSLEDWYLYRLKQDDWERRHLLASLWYGTGILEARKLIKGYGEPLDDEARLAVDRVRRWRVKGWRVGLPVIHGGPVNPTLPSTFRL